VVTVTNAGTLGGTGTIPCPVDIGPGGTLSPGASIGTLTINNTLTLHADSTTRMEINATASTRDQVVGVTTLSYGGTLAVVNLGGVLTVNDSFKLFTAETYTGAFAAITPATPAPGLAWEVSTLATDGHAAGEGRAES
jgi:outer membrane autotransporter protein